MKRLQKGLCGGSSHVGGCVEEKIGEGGDED